MNAEATMHKLHRETKLYLQSVGNFLGGWPAHYLSFDIETTGMKVDDPLVLPVEVGWCLVENNEVVLNDAVVLDWFALDGLDHEAFGHYMEKTATSMHEHGLRYPFTPRFLEQQGLPPREAMAIVAEKLAEAIELGIPIVGHNLYGFDRPILERTARDWTEVPLTIPANSVIDTMCIERGRRKRAPLQALPRSSSRHDWYMGLQRGPEKCSLHKACGPAYGFAIDHEQSHSAGYDALLVHRLLQGMRSWAFNDISGD